MTSPKPNILTIKGVDKGLWRWLKARAALDGIPIGEAINELIERHRTELKSLQGPAGFSYTLTIEGLDWELWDWLSNRAQEQGKTLGEISNEVLTEYRNRRTAPHKGDWHDMLTVRGIDRELWQWLRTCASGESKAAGQILNELIAQHRNRTEQR